MLTPAQTLGLHALETLPDSTRAKRQLLLAIVASLPKNDEVRLKAQLMLEILNNFDREQQRLPFSLTEIMEKKDGQ